MLSVQYGNIGSMDKRLSSFNNVFKKEKIGYSAAGKEEEFILHFTGAQKCLYSIFNVFTFYEKVMLIQK